MYAADGHTAHALDRNPNVIRQIFPRDNNTRRSIRSIHFRLYCCQRDALFFTIDDRDSLNRAD